MKSKWQAVFFDFDGVILDSVDVKTQAFAKMFRQYGPEVEQAVVDYHLANGGISRFEKFEYYYRFLLDKSINQDVLGELGQEFNKLVFDGVLAAPFIDGALETLQQLKKKGMPAFVVSGTPHGEVQMIVEMRNLTPYFLEVHGSPRKKHEIVQDLSHRHSYCVEHCMFIGDAMTDFEAARICNTSFLGIVKGGALSPFPSGTHVSERVCLNQTHNSITL